MTFKEVAIKAEELRAKYDARQSIHVGVSVWSSADGFRDLQWNIWTGKDHIYADTGEKVLADYEAATNVLKIVKDMETVGEVSVPEKKEGDAELNF